MLFAPPTHLPHPPNHTTPHQTPPQKLKPRAREKVEVLAGLWALVWAHIHHFPLIYGTMFSLVLSSFDVCKWFWLWCNAHGGVSCYPPGCCVDGSSRSAVASYQDEVYEGGVKVCAIEVKVAVSHQFVCCADAMRIDFLRPLQYIYVSLPSVDKNKLWAAWHPVSISSRPIYVADDQYDPLKGVPTITFSIHVRADQRHRHSWSAEVHRLCEERKLGRIRVMGPLGRPSIDPRRYEHVVLVAGGAGAAPLMGLLEYYLDPVWGKQVPEGKSRTQVVTLVWAAKDRRMFDLFCAQQPAGAVRMALDVDNERPTSNLNFVFRTFLHETGTGVNPLTEIEMQQDLGRAPGGYAVDQLQESADAKAASLGCQRVQIVYKGRPNLWGSGLSKYPNVFEHLSEQNERGNPEVPGLSGSILSCGVVVCGPESMRNEVRRSTDRLNWLNRKLRFHVHTENWDEP